MNRSRSLYLLSPAPLIAITWLFMFVGVFIGYTFRDRLPVTLRTMQMNGVDFDFPLTGMVWTGTALLAFVIFGAAATRPIPRAAITARPDELSLSLKLAALAHAFILVVVIAWVLTSAMKVGGVDRLIAMAAEQDTYEAKASMLANKFFPGMRLLYTGLGGLGVFGACVVAANLRSEDRKRKDMLIGLSMFLLSALALSILPIFLSQRILLIHMVLSTFVGVSMVSGRLFHIRYGIVLAGLLLTVWTLREVVTVGSWASEYSAHRIGLEKLLYYLINDFYNAVTPFSAPFLHTYGLYTFEFLLSYGTFGEEGTILAALADRIAVLNELRGGGTFPNLTAPYIDFSWAGILLIIALAVLFTWIFNRAHRSFAFAVLYGQIGGALLLGPHVAWYSNPNFTFNILLTAFVCAFIRGRPRTDGAGEGVYRRQTA